MVPRKKGKDLHYERDGLNSGEYPLKIRDQQRKRRWTTQQLWVEEARKALTQGRKKRGGWERPRPGKTCF